MFAFTTQDLKVCDDYRLFGQEFLNKKWVEG
jgi:hypothetical protein